MRTEQHRGWSSIGAQTDDATVLHHGEQAENVRHEDGDRSTWKCVVCGAVAPFTSPRQAALAERVATPRDEAVAIRQSLEILALPEGAKDRDIDEAGLVVAAAAEQYADVLDPKPVRPVKLRGSQ